MESNELFSIKDEPSKTNDSGIMGLDDLDIDNLDVPEIVIKVVGVGGAGGNALNTIIESGINDVDFIAVNTDVAALRRSKAPKRLILGRTTTKGRGAGADPTKGLEAAQESAEHLEKLLEKSDMVFITAGMGGGTGTGASPEIAAIAKEKIGALVVAVVTFPFDWEGKGRRDRAIEGIEKLRQKVDAIIIVQNNRIIELSDKSTTCTEAFKMSDDVLRQAVTGVTGVVRKVLQINVDFEDVCKTMRNAGTAIIGVGEVDIDSCNGESAILKAANAAMNGPMMTTPMNGATSVLYSVESGTDLPIHELNEAAQLIQANASKEAKITWGQGIDSTMGNKVRFTLIATGFKDASVAEGDKGSIVIDSHNLTPADVVSEEQSNTSIFAGLGGAELDIPTALRRRKK